MLHKKARRQNTVYLKNNLIFSTGYSQTDTRECGLWNEVDQHFNFIPLILNI